MKVFICEKCLYGVYPPCKLTVNDEDPAPEYCPYNSINESRVIWKLEEVNK